MVHPHGMRTLIYKRTHHGDPDVTGQFGICDCMGRVRMLNFEALIGVGGIGAGPESHSLARKVNWIGIGPTKGRWYKRGPIVTFDHFLFYGADGPPFEMLAPQLANRIYSRNVRLVMTSSLNTVEKKEVEHVLQLAMNAHPSSGRADRRGAPNKKC